MSPYYGAVLGIIGGVTLLQLANTILSVVLPLHLTLAGFSGTTTGIVTTAYGVGFLAGCVVAHRLIRSVGHIRAFAVLAAVCSILSMVFTTSGLVWIWFALRLVMGFCQAGLFTVVEGWLSAATPPKARGGVLSFYLVSTKVAIVGGQLVLGHVDTTALGWFDVAGAVFSLSLIPVALTRTPQPPPPRLELLSPRDLYRVAPAAIVGCTCSGLLSSAVIGLTPVYGTRLGLSVEFTVWLLTAIQLGSFFLQWPLGRLSDRIDRRSVIAGCALAVAGLSFGIMLAQDRLWLLLILFFLWGGGSLTFYAVAVAHGSDFADPDQMVGVSSGSLLAWAVGAAIGPTIAAPFLDLVGPEGLFLYALLVSAVLAAFVLYRMTRRAPLPPEAREGFVSLPATSPRLVEIDPRVPERPAS
ncbi:MFS transporter [Benzoatithermus flavus]|uniref:MFS transporter n=1 Tax=Benzoatithermus flavus TaxID=3108223 RepID=A0ABU8XQU4_9PROT